MTLNGEVSPSAVDLEEAVIGSLLIDKEALDTAIDILSEDCFYEYRFREMFIAAKALVRRKEPVDMLTLTSELRRTQKLEGVGGAYGITQTTAKIASTMNVEAHCRIILQQFIRRRIIELGFQNIKRAQNQYEDALDILDEWVKESKILYDYVTNGRIISIDQIYQNTVADMKKVDEKGISFGIKAIDDYLICLRKGFKYTVGGRPGMGKSSLVKTFACNFVQQKSPGIIFSMEMTSEQMMMQIIAGVCEMDNQRIQQKKLNDTDWNIINKKMSEFRKDLLVIDDRAQIGPDYMHRRVKKLKQSLGIEWFMVDYMQMMKMPWAEAKGKTKEQQIGDMSQALKDISKSENVACF